MTVTLSALLTLGQETMLAYSADPERLRDDNRDKKILQRCKKR